MKATFLRHEGYLGAVGAFMKTLHNPSDQLANGDHSLAAAPSQKWAERYATALMSRGTSPSSSSSLATAVNPRGGVVQGATRSEFELEHLGDMSLEPFPLLLSSVDYVPDTWDLTQDSKARVYWLGCFKVRVSFPSRLLCIVPSYSPLLVARCRAAA